MWFLYAFALVAGALNALQSGSNATLSKTLEQPFVAALIVFAVSAAALLAAGLVSGQIAAPAPGRWAEVPWWAWIGGVLGVGVVLSQLYVAQAIGAGPYIGLTVTAGTVVSLLLDHFGLMGFEQHPAGFARIAGAALMVAGVFLVARF